MTIKKLDDVNPENVFRLKGGKSLKSLHELAAELSSMSNEVFRHHVSGERHDFYNWVHSTIKDRELAEEISKIKDKAKMAKAVKSRISLLEKADHLQACELRKSLRCGIREFCMGLVTGVAAGLMFAAAIGMI